MGDTTKAKDFLNMLRESTVKESTVRWAEWEFMMQKNEVQLYTGEMRRSGLLDWQQIVWKQIDTGIEDNFTWPAEYYLLNAYPNP